MAAVDRPTHVLMTADAVGGVWTYATELCGQLARRGVQVTLAVMGPQPSFAQREAVTRVGVTVCGRPFRLEWMDDAWQDVMAAGEWLLALDRELRPDIVHLNGYCHGALAWGAPTVMVGHSCVLSWWRAVRHEPVPDTWDRYAREVKQGLHSATAVIAPSAAMLGWLNELYGPLSRSRVILNGRSLTKAAVDKEPLILTAGRFWDQAKNVAAVCEVAINLEWPVALAGARGSTESGVPPVGIQCLGQIGNDELLDWMMRASIYVAPARYEPFGLAILEAALCGCALVLGDIPSLREIWADAAIYVAPADRVGLQSVLADLIRDHRKRNALAGAARERAAMLTAARMTDDYCDLYAELMRERCPLLSLSAV